MKKLSEIIICYLLLVWIIVMAIDNNRINGHKKCCIKTAQEVYEYEGWVIKEQNYERFQYNKKQR